MSLLFLRFSVSILKSHTAQDVPTFLHGTRTCRRDAALMKAGCSQTGQNLLYCPLGVRLMLQGDYMLRGIHLCFTNHLF